MAAHMAETLMRSSKAAYAASFLAARIARHRAREIIREAAAARSRAGVTVETTRRVVEEARLLRSASDAS